ncbi:MULTISPECIES: NAD-dependent epimerase/dehydratase family protein [Prochlorococcus]|uniref:UDP-glucose 4-epimerase n=2 Tax=Prochlorococcus TaxID=1218 RepID=Q7VC69_PROMA|nr:NAD-dependent epimerase/dehydratase family protein [Prochlorococcus marinus]AAP99917.1 NAD dependent epimerase/dehydratase [Prochlorococcus marinus subsp. marinus str. CCMP1375]KGG11735.1 Ribosome-associated endonuclease [Prochlorococcus marinus str. LG]KGG23611.1 Ribosome-associated endonuclease [Prochlorococcus marinus str. SS35]KGG35156.1 Ribosome-associated endonuclease [Prochlorococcus sp. SS52]KGG18851.1 Ribosome-associated endonuclease [Prochlorococcus marinus str. SS2]
MGGTRFVGKALLGKLQEQGHDLTIFTRGVNSLPSNVRHIQGDRNGDEIEKLNGLKFDVIIDSSGRTKDQTKKVLDITGPPANRFLYVSSAGIYADSETLPLTEDSKVDLESRHIGKAETENWLRLSKVPFTSFRPTYIYGAGNYNPIEKWFFERILNDRPIPIPNEGNTITQLGHVNDLAEAMSLSLEKEVSNNRIYNCSGKKAITFRGLIYSSALACGKDPNDIKLFSFDPSKIDKKARKIFPLRLNHFFTDISLIENHLNWSPRIELNEGLRESFQNDYLINKNEKPDFSLDINLIGY